jgi:spore coat polysaccharide biosynthesis protein SpsF
MNKRIGAIIPIRLASERLPGKALIEICGRPIVWHLLDRIAASRFLEKADVVVCTTQDASDDPLADAVATYGASVFRGSRDDLIKRFHDAIEERGFDAVIQVDGDDPLSDTEYMDLTMERLLADPSLDIVTCDGLPLGIATKSFTRESMRKVFRHYQTEKNDTGFIYFFTRSGLCRVARVGPRGPEHVLDEARLTLDYQEDLEVFTRIFEALYRPGEVFGLSEVVRFLKQHPEVMKLNAGLDEAYWQRTREKAQLYFKDAAGVVQKI